LVQRVAGQADDVEGVHHRDRVRQLFGGGGLEAGEAVHRDDLDAVAPGLVPVAQPVLERLLRAALEHGQQSRGAGAVADRGVRSMTTVTYLSPFLVCRQACSSTPTTRTPSRRAGSLMSRRCPSARTASLAVFHDTPQALRRRGPWTGAGPRCRPAPTAGRRGRSWPVAAPLRWCPDATRASTRCTCSGAP